MASEDAWDEAADELYALLPQDFTGSRNARAKAAKSAGDRELASAIAGLRRPSAAAFVVNLLARERPDLVEQLLELADALRSAQETLSGPELRALSTQRHRVIASIVGEARTLAAGREVHVSDAVQRELESTFDAALADPQAAEAVRSGRLVSALSYAGLGAAPTATPPAPAVRTKAPKKPRETDTKTDTKTDAKADAMADAEARRREREHARQVAEQAVREAEEALKEASTARNEAGSDATEAAEHADEVQRRTAELQSQLEAAERDAVAAAERVRETSRTAKRAERAAEEAQRRVDSAQAALEKLPAD